MRLAKGQMLCAKPMRSKSPDRNDTVTTSSSCQLVGKQLPYMIRYPNMARSAVSKQKQTTELYGYMAKIRNRKHIDRHMVCCCRNVVFETVWGSVVCGEMLSVGKCVVCGSVSC